MRNNRTGGIFLASVIFMLAVTSCASVGAEEEKFEYRSFGRRDPFVPLVGIKKKAGASGIMSVLTVDDISLEGILVNSDGTKSVIMNGDILRVGEQKGRVKVEAITVNAVKVKINEAVYDIKLYQ